MQQCTIKWPHLGTELHPDANDAIGLAVNWQTRRHAYNTGHDGGAAPEPNGEFPICAEHATRLPLAGWTLAPLGFDPSWLTPPELCPRCAGRGRLPSNHAPRGFCPECQGCGLQAGKCDVEIVNATHFAALLELVRSRPSDVQDTFARCMNTLCNLSRHGKVRVTPDSKTGLYFSADVYCGGVIYHGAGDSGVGGPAFAVRFGSEECWQIHT